MKNKIQIGIFILFVLVGTYFLTGFVFSVLNGKNIIFYYHHVYWLLPFDALIANQPFIFKSLLISFVVSLMFFLISVVFLKKNSSNIYGDADFANSNDIGKAGLFGKKGIIVGKYKDKILRFGGNQFVSLQAPTRSGKGVAVVIPNLLEWEDSAVILDIKKECFNITSKYRRDHLNNQVYLFDPFSMNTHKYNPLDYVDFNSIDGEVNLNNIAKILFPSVGKDSYWADNARILFCGIVYLLNDLIKNKKTTLKMNINSVLQLKDGHDGLSLKEFYDTLDNELLSKNTKLTLPKIINIASENTLGIIYSTFDSTLSIFGIDVIANATSSSDFDLRKVRKEKITIYIGIIPSKLMQASMLINLFFSHLILENTQELPEDNPEIKHKCLLLLDEMTSIGYMEVILKGCAFIAGYWLRLLLVYQSKAQLRESEPKGYGDTGAKVLIDNCACNLIYTPKQEDAREYSDALGYKTIKNYSQSRSKNNISQSESDTRRALMLPQELREMSFNDEIIMIDGVKPIKAKKAFYYSEKEILSKLKLVSPTIANTKKLNEDVFKLAFQNGETKINI